MDEETAIVDLDWREGQEQTGCSDKQTAFVRALMDGANKTQAAREAGYGGEGSTLRSHASQLAKSHKVRALIAWAQAGGAGPTDVPGDPEELKRILWRHARAKDPARSIKATEVLHRLDAQEREALAARPAMDPISTLNEIAKCSVILAQVMADKANILWQAPEEPEDEARADFLRVYEAVQQLARKYTADGGGAAHRTEALADRGHTATETRVNGAAAEVAE